MKTSILIVMALILSGCGTFKEPQYYASIGAGYKVSADKLLLPETVGGRNPTARFGAGVEFENGVKIGYEHWSHWRDGGPFNNRPETHKDEIFIEKVWYFND